MEKKLSHYFFISLVAHLVIFILFMVLTSMHRIAGSFVVFGAHSNRPTYAYFKALRTSASANAQGAAISQNNAGSAKKRAEKKKKAAALKKEKEMAAAKKAKKLKAAAIAQKSIKKEVVQAKPQERKASAVAKASDFAKAKADTSADRKDEAEEEKEQVEESVEEKGWFALEGVGSDDPEFLVYQKSVQREIDRVWRPPPGITKGTECTMKFTLDNTGDVKEYSWIKRSKVLVYDASVLQIIKQLHFNKKLYGATFSVTFYQ